MVVELRIQSSNKIDHLDQQVWHFELIQNNIEGRHQHIEYQTSEQLAFVKESWEGGVEGFVDQSVEEPESLECRFHGSNVDVNFQCLQVQLLVVDCVHVYCSANDDVVEIDKKISLAGNWESGEFSARFVMTLQAQL